MKRFLLISTFLVSLATPTFADVSPTTYTIPDLVGKVSDAVVNILGTDTDLSPKDVTIYDEFFDNISKSKNKKLTSEGSGFIIDPTGIIITNNHVINGRKFITVVFPNDKKLKATVIGTDPKRDIAVLKVENDTPLPFVQFGDSDKVKIGERVVAIGNPFGIGETVTTGIISAKHRQGDFLQTDASINKGNSGGPLFNLEGEVIGINSMIISPSGASDGIAFSIPSNLAVSTIKELEKYHEPRHGWIGVALMEVSSDIAQAYGITKDKGALISAVTKDSPAEEAGLEVGDIIVKIDDKKINKVEELPDFVMSKIDGETVQLTIVRDGKEIVKEVKLGKLK